MTLRSRLLLIFSLFALLVVAVSAVQYRQIRETTRSFRQLERETSPTLNSLLEISTAARRASIKILEYALGNRTQDRGKARQALSQLQAQVERFLDLSRGRVPPQMHERLLQLSGELKAAVTHSLGNRSGIQPAMRPGNTETGNPLQQPHPGSPIQQEVDRLNRARRALIHFLKPLIREQYRRQERLSLDTADALTAANRLQLLSMLTLALIALLLGAVLWRSLARPLTQLSKTIGRFRLDQPPKVDATGRGDEIGDLARSFVRMAENLRRQHIRVQENEERFSKVFYNLPLALAILDLEQETRMDLNDTYARQLGYTRDELLGLSVFEGVSWVDGEAQRQTIRTLVERGSVYNLPTAIRVRSGSVRHFLFSGSMLDFHGRKLAMVTLVDITERVQLEQELRRQQEHLEQLVEERTPSLRDKARIIDQTHDSIITTDLDGRILSWNRGR